MSRSAGRVVLVDERPERRRVLREVFLASGVPRDDIGEADDVDAAAEVVADSGADVVVLERPSPLPAGVAAIARLRHRFPRLTIAVCSFDRHHDAEPLELAAGADFHLGKPLRTEDVRRVVARPGADCEGRPDAPLISSGAAPPG